jgi:alanine racemase
MRYKTRLEVNLKKFESNVEKLRLRLPDSEILFMVKANAYGHGLYPIVSFASEKLKIKNFGVATLGEANYLREKLSEQNLNGSFQSGFNYDIYVFSELALTATDLSHLNYYLDKKIIPVISDLEILESLLQHQGTSQIPLCLKFDTGMKRLGINYEDVEKVVFLLRKYSRSEVFHLMSHLATSNILLAQNSSLNIQYQRYLNIKKYFQDSQIKIINSSLANSGAIEQKFAVENETHIRPGLMLYGPPSCLDLDPQNIWDGESISSLRGQVIQIKNIKKNEEIGYGLTKSNSDGIVAYLALGYGDGIPNYYHNMTFNYQGYQASILGRVSMDMLALFFSFLDGQNSHVNKVIKCGDVISLWDHNIQSVLKIAKEVSSTPYEIYCGISDRIPRAYVY